MRKRSVALALAAGTLVAVQLVPVRRTNRPVRGEVEAPAEVMKILRRSCYDCHSNETAWPWYSRVAPVSWLVARDVDEGREHVNFSDWRLASVADREEALEELEEVMEEREMPLWYYLPLHAEARMAEADREVLASWARSERGLVPGGLP